MPTKENEIEVQHTHARLSIIVSRGVWVTFNIEHVNFFAEMTFQSPGRCDQTTYTVHLDDMA
jgi:hypothetical protein